MNLTSRRNRMGQWFLIMVIADGRTRISHDGNDILTSMTVQEVLDAWDGWTVGGMLIQDAFPKLTASQREFLMTAITESEWKKMFDESPLNVSGHEIVEVDGPHYYPDTETESEDN